MFIDTNVFVYARNRRANQHYVASSLLERAVRNAEPARISRQILREFLATVTRPQTWGAAMSTEDAARDVTRIARQFEVLEDGPQVTTNLLILCNEVIVGGNKIHDANIVATMLAYGERNLMTFNVADFRRYDHLIEIVSE